MLKTKTAESFQVRENVITYWLADDSSVLSLNMLGVWKRNFVRTEKTLSKYLVLLDLCDSGGELVDGGVVGEG